VRTDRDRLQDILDAIELAQEYVGRGRASFDADQSLRDALSFRVATIGEATRSLSQSLRDANPQVPWRQIGSMRNILIHSYFGINYDIVWSVATNDLPILEQRVRAILASGTP